MESVAFSDMLCKEEGFIPPIRGLWVFLSPYKNSMTLPDDNYVKIAFRFYSGIFDQEIVETMWATVVDREKGHYKLDSIPFYAPLIASDDIVYAVYDDDEQMLAYRKTESPSGNSTVQVMLLDKSPDMHVIRDMFAKLGCVSEKVNEAYFVMEIPAAVDYQPIKLKLDEMEAKEIIGYAEPCLSAAHKR